MMKPSPLNYLIVPLIMFSLLSCVTTGTQPTPTSDPSAKAPKQAAAFDHKSSRDTVNWATTNTNRLKPIAKETDREHLGERIGLIGPIVATHGVGSKRFVLVYDSAGVLVGGLTYKVYKKEPQRFEALMKKAQMRSEHQNIMAVKYLMHQQIANQMAAAQKEKGGRHDK